MLVTNVQKIHICDFYEVYVVLHHIADQAFQWKPTVQETHQRTKDLAFE